MRALCLAVLGGALVLGACDSAQEITAPEIPDPQFHTVPFGTPDGDYSMYYFDLNLAQDLVLKLAQEFVPGTLSTMCPGNIIPGATGIPTTHNEDGDEPPFPGVLGLAPASGFGSFLKREGLRRTSGLLFVRGACWFDEWNEVDGGFPESAWVAGWALVGWRVMSFHMMLQSRGFPAEGHLKPLELDRGVLFLGSSQTPALDLLGEIHHEDGLTLIQ